MPNLLPEESPMRPATASRTTFGITVAVLALIVAACSSPSATPSPSAGPSATAGPSVTVTLEDNEFVVPGDEVVDGNPALTIPVGTTVEFENAGLESHTASDYINGFPTFQLEGARFNLFMFPGMRSSLLFDEAGTYYVGCIPHPGMDMVVIVE
jgi:nitrite reductase (NO-forming)